MRYTVSFAIFLYAVAAIIDVALGISTLNQVEAYLFRFASVATVIAAYLLISKRKRLGPLLFILISLALSLVTLTLDRTDPPILISVALKIVAAVLTLKPEVIEVEIIIEDED